MKKFYLTTTLPYVNDNPHLGHALEFVQADVIARYHKSKGEEVFFNTGTDEHGLKVYRKALEAGEGAQVYADRYARRFKDIMARLGIEYSRFIRTTDSDHVQAAQEFWRRCGASGDIYKAVYKVKYCVGCELEKTESELADDRCPIHPNLAIERIEEENYFFRFSKYREPLLKLYEKYPDFVVPESRLKEIRNFVSAGLQDFSISRTKAKMPWGIPVPNDSEQVMYVWFDALINYVSTLGWPEEATRFEEFWGTAEHPNAVQIAGKDNLRQQSAMWQAMLLSAGLPSSRLILIHGFITSGGLKMSKTLGNIIDPAEIIDEYGAEAFRFFMTHEISVFEDSDVTRDRLKESYNAHLANGLGNLLSRVMKMAVDAEAHLAASAEEGLITAETSGEYGYDDYMRAFEFQKAITSCFQRVRNSDAYIQEHQPFKLIKENKEEARRHLEELLKSLFIIGSLLAPFMPETSRVVLDYVRSPRVVETPLFLRK